DHRSFLSLGGGLSAARAANHAAGAEGKGVGRRSTARTRSGALAERSPAAARPLSRSARRGRPCGRTRGPAARGKRLLGQQGERLGRPWVRRRRFETADQFAPRATVCEPVTRAARTALLAALPGALCQAYLHTVSAGSGLGQTA